MLKTSIRFFNGTPIRAVWNENESKWFFSVLDIVSSIRKVDDYEKTAITGNI